MPDIVKQDDDYSFYDIFVPLTNKKVIIFFFIIGLFVYFNMLFNGFVWDDLTYIVRNTNMHSVNLSYSFGPNMFNVDGQYRPIPALYYSFVYTLFGNTPFILHGLQLLLHITSVVLLFFILNKFFVKNVSFFLATIFLVHPMNVESVAYFAQTTSTIFFLFGGTAFFLSTKRHLSLQRLCLIFTLCLLSMLTKETGVLFLFLILLYRVLYFKNNLLKLFAGSIASVVIYVLIRVFIGHVYLSVRHLAPIASISLDERLLTMPKIMFYYLKTFFFPVTLVIDQQWVVTSPNFFDVFLPLMLNILFLLIIVVIGIYIGKKRNDLLKPFLFFTLWYAAAFLFISQIFPLDATVADRWFYLPMVGLLGLMGVLYETAWKKFKININLVLFVVITIVVLLSVRTIVRNSNWYSVFTLYGHDSEIIDNFHLENNLGYEYIQINDNANAIIHLKKSVALWPYELSLLNLGGAYMSLGDTQNAKKYLQQALALDTNNAYAPHKHDRLTYLNYTAILLTTDTPEKTDAFLKTALQDYTDDPSLLVLDAMNKLRMKKKQEALMSIQKAQKKAPKDPFIKDAYTKISEGKPIIFNYAGKSYTYK